jgi:DNA-binding transcriptional ArsR family regulator
MSSGQQAVFAAIVVAIGLLAVPMAAAAPLDDTTNDTVDTTDTVDDTPDEMSDATADIENATSGTDGDLDSDTDVPDVDDSDGLSGASIENPDGHDSHTRDLVSKSGKLATLRNGEVSASETEPSVEDGGAADPSDSGGKSGDDAVGSPTAMDSLDAKPASSNSGGGGGTPAPDVPPSGVAVGVGALAAAAVLTKQGALSGLSDVGARSALGSALDRFVPFVPLRYSRYDDSDPLEHETREAVFAMVEENPGTYLSEVCDDIDIPLSTARHHIRVLEQEEMLTSAKVRGRRRFYPAHTEGVELAAAMNDESTAVVLDTLARRGPSSVSELADALDRDPSTITHHVKRLEGDDLVVREREGRAILNSLSPEVRTALEPEVTTETVSEAVASSAD